MGDSQSHLAAASITQSSCHHSNAGTGGSLNLYHLQQRFPVSESNKQCLHDKNGILHYIYICIYIYMGQIQYLDNKTEE